jgi:hypothetical protein
MTKKQYLSQHFFFIPERSPTLYDSNVSIPIHIPIPNTANIKFCIKSECEKLIYSLSIFLIIKKKETKNSI